MGWATKYQPSKIIKTWVVWYWFTFLNLQVATLVGNVYIYLWSMESMDCLGEQLSNTIKGRIFPWSQLGSRTWSPSCQPRWYSASRTRLNFDLPAELGCEAEIGSNWGLNYLGVGWASNKWIWSYVDVLETHSNLLGNSMGQGLFQPGGATLDNWFNYRRNPWSSGCVTVSQT